MTPSCRGRVRAAAPAGWVALRLPPTGALQSIRTGFGRNPAAGPDLFPCNRARQFIRRSTSDGPAPPGNGRGPLAFRRPIG